MEILHPEERWLEEMTEDEEPSTLVNTLSAIATNVLLFFLVFGLSATVEIKSLKSQLTNKAAIFTGVAMQFVVMPLLGFAAVCMLGFTEEFTQPMGITLMVVTASPGGSFSNWWCSLFNADLALSVAMTSVSSVLSVGLLPANLVLYSWLAFVVVMPDGNDIHILEALDLKSIFISLGVVMAAIILGLYAGFVYSSHKFHKRANKFGSVCGLLLILFSGFLGSGGGGGNANFWSLHWSFYVGTAFPCVVGMLLANVISRGFKLSYPETVAISIECCYQNTAIATSVAATMFSDPTTRTQAISVPLFYGLVEALLIAIYCVWAWKLGWTKAPADEKLCVVVTRTYEFDDDDDDDVIEWQTEEQSGWFARLFIPREMERNMASRRSRRSTNLSAGLGGSKPLRKRMDSSDITVATQRSRLDSADNSNSPEIPIGDVTPQDIIKEEPEDLEEYPASVSSPKSPLEPLTEESGPLTPVSKPKMLRRTSDQSMGAPHTPISKPQLLRRSSDQSTGSYKSVNMAGDMNSSEFAPLSPNVHKC
jgi:predicted Na+-dependent transporter